jgi:polyferredoxin
MTLLTDAVLWPIAALMAWVTAVLIRWAAEARTAVAQAVVGFLLAMMVAMFGGATIYFFQPGPGALAEGLWLAGALMAVSVFPLFSAFLREVTARAKAGEGYVPPSVEGAPAFVAVVVALVLGNELLMGTTFTLASGAPVVGGAGVLGTLTALANVVDSSWFLFTMALEMGFTAYLLRARLPPAARVVLLAQALLMFLSPPALSDPGWRLAAIGLSSAGMIALFVFAMEHLYRHRTLEGGFARYLERLLAVYAVMMAGLYLWLADGTPLLFALSVVLEMVLYFEAVAAPRKLGAGAPLTWTLDPAYTFRVLLGIFVAEVFMGALLDQALEGPAFAALLPALPLAGPAGTVAANALTNGFWFLSAVTGSTWFLLMMGVEMGALVVFKLRETRSFETRVRLALMMGCYGAFAVYFPSAYYSAVFPNAPAGTSVPVLGWSMGLGSGPVAPSLFLAILLTYAITGALVVLFGRRVICSTFCTAPLMYQGTTVDAMSGFNRTSPLARKYLSSRFSTVYTATTGATLAALAAFSLLSYLDQVGRLHVSVLGADPSAFYFAFSFSVLWYLMFVTIPYTGNYNCVTMGWCYTGAIAQAFQKVGAFELRVKDKAVCRACTTLDCAKRCPVGLVDMPGHFRRTGRFRSTKCCGVGNCVGACPYGNLYIRDIRHWIRDRLGRGTDHPRAGPPLPMVRAGARPEAGPAAASPPLGPKA